MHYIFENHFRHGKLNVLQMYLHRFLRMMPLMTVVILSSMSLLRFFGNGPLWPLAMDLLSGACQRYWWSTFSFIQNYVNPDNLVCFAFSFRKMIRDNDLLLNFFCSATQPLGIFVPICNSFSSLRSSFIQFIDIKPKH